MAPSIPLPVLAGADLLPQATPATAEVAARVATHPCYSRDAHQYYARMHVPVAPGCNIQCHYCNRRHDCSNESRPGVTSALLTPRQALERVVRVAAAVKQLSVVGVAGPGEPLANARRTMHTLDLIGRTCPDLRLCLSTNGLALPDHVERLVALGVDHVTVTINCTDPEVGARIYPWVAHRGRRYTGTAAAEILIERQLAGVRALARHGVLCKVNSVLIPGVNDEHLLAVSRTVRELGAFAHNVMPLVSRPEHGTHFGLTGQRGPTDAELATVRDRCEAGAGGSMEVMRHCRACRADAVGMLGENLATADPPADPPAGTAVGASVGAAVGTAVGAAVGAAGHDLEGRRAAHESIERWRAEVHASRSTGGIATGAVAAGGTARPARTVLVAVASTGQGVVNQHFGRATEFWIYEAAAGWARFVGVRQVPRGCAGPDACGEPSDRLDATVSLLAGCAAVLCNKIGPHPHGALVAAGIQPVEVHDLVDQAVAAAGARLTGARP